MYACVREDVAAAIAQGYNLHTIWEWLRDEGRFLASYQMFCRYVHRDHQGMRRDKTVPQRRHTSLSASTMPPPPKPKPAATPVSVAAPIPKPPPVDGIGGFYMQPMSKEELFG